MRIIGFAVAFALLAPPAQAEWSTTQSGRIASACTVDETGGQLCLFLGCDGEGRLGWGLTHAGLPALEAADSVRAEITVGSQTVGVVPFEAESDMRFTAPLDTTAQPGFEWIKRGLRADLRLTPAEDAPQIAASFSLDGSRRAIETVEDTCPRPEFTTVATDGRPVVENPAEAVLETARAACTLLGGTVSVQGGFVREIDIDGIPPMDLALYHPAAQCSAAPTAPCGQDGCMQSLWLAEDDGAGYREILSQALYGVSVAAPGELLIDVSARACGRPQASACRKQLRLDGTELRDFGPVAAD